MFLSPEQSEQRKAANQAEADQIALDNAPLIQQHDALFRKIESDLQQIEADLDTLLGIENDALKLGKKVYQVIHGSVKVHAVSDNIGTIKATVAGARKLIVETN